jgi:UDP-N-acetylglucosamine 4,6-dehydratase
MGSRGSVIPYFQQLAEKSQPLPITDFKMTRFWIPLESAASFILDSFSLMRGGELYVPKIPSMKIIDLAKAISPKSELIEIGLRPGEKMHEEMISIEDGPRTKLINSDRYVILPLITEWNYKEPAGQKLPLGFAYNSNTNVDWLSVDDIQRLLIVK